MNITNNKEALTLGLVLSITGTEEESKQALVLAEQIASTMTEKDVEKCKQQADWILKNKSNFKRLAFSNIYSDLVGYLIKEKKN